MTRGATTGWLAAGGASVLPGGKDGNVGSDAAPEPPEVCCPLGVEDALGVLESVAVGLLDAVGVDETVGRVVGATECAGEDATWVGVLAGLGDTEMLPRPVRTPSVAVAVVDFVNVTDLDAEAGVFAGSRSENDVPATRIVTDTSVRFANVTQPPYGTYVEETAKARPLPCAIVMALHDAAAAGPATTKPKTATAATPEARSASINRVRITAPWCVTFLGASGNPASRCKGDDRDEH